MQFQCRSEFTSLTSSTSDEVVVVTQVYNDMLLAADGGQVTALCLLDLTAVFDTGDHDLLLFRLERQFGIHCIVLQWFHSRTIHICRAVKLTHRRIIRQKI